MDKKLFILDAYALIYRAYYAFINRPITNSKGENVSAVFGFINTLDDILRNEKPTHIAVAFDPPTPTFRHEMYKEYKANREKTPEDIKLSVPIIRDFIDAFNVTILEEDGFEADDVVGTVSKKAAKEGFQVFMMTPDKDYMQLVNEQVFMYKPGRSGGDKEIIDIEGVKNKFSIETPKQVIDILALWGDASDNIPGAPGIGEKTAKKLISQYGSVEKLLNSTHELKGKQKENLENFREQVELSKTLVTINTEVPIDLDFNKLEVIEPNKERLSELFDAQNFNNLKKRILGVAKVAQAVQGSLFGDTEAVVPENEVTAYNSFDISKVTYTLVSEPNELKDLVNKLLKIKAFCFDTETTGLNIFSDSLLGIAISWREGEAFYVKVNEHLGTSDIIEKLSPVFTSKSILKIGHNLKFDMGVLYTKGAKFSGPYFDTMIAHYLLRPDARHKLDDVVTEYFNYQMIPIEELIGKKGKNQLTLNDVDVDSVKNYACEDADYTFRLFEVLQKKLQEKNLLKLAEDIEMPLLEVLFHMEHSGFTLDIGTLNAYNKDLISEIKVLEKEIYDLAGEEFNIASPKQLGVILFDKLVITDKVQKTKTKQYKTGEEILQKLVDKHEIVPKILEYRGLSKLQSTYVASLPQLIEPVTGKIHTSFNQTIAATGRLSSINPNMQNIPIRDAKGREIRKSFIPSQPERFLMAADYSQIELRLMAHLSGDENMIEAFKQGADIHTSTASKVFKVAEEDVSREMRSQAKTANFGIIYGISAFGLAERLRISRSDAKTLIDSYFISFPKVKLYMDKSIEFAKSNGYVETMYGRKRYLPDIQSANATVRGFAERNAINSPIQGSAADVIKIAMLNIHNKIFDKYDSTMLLQVHDELVFDVLETELTEFKDLIISEMENVVQLSVPLIADCGIGKNWLEAH